MKSAKQTSVLSYFATAFYIVSALFYMPYLVRTLGVSDYGIYALATSLIGYFSLDFGIGAAQTRLAAKYIAEDRPEKIRNMLGITSRIFLVIDLFILIVSTIVYFDSDSLFPNLTANELIRFKNVFIVTTVFVLINFPMLPVKGLFQAFDHVYEFVLIDLVYKIINLISIISALYFGLGLYGVVLANVGSNIAVQFFRFYYIFKKEHLSVNITAHDKEVMNFITSFSLWATVAMVADKFFFGIIPFLLASFANTREVAIFAIVISIEGYTLSISRSLSGIFLPRVMKMVINGEEKDEKTRLMTRVGRVQLFIVGLLITGLVCMGREFIQLWLGEGFDRSYYCLILVLIPCLFHLTQTIAEELILATNQVKYRALAYVVGSTLSVVSIVILAPQYGAFSAAIGCFLSFVIAHNLLIDIIYQKRLGINMFYFLSHCQVRILPSFVVCCLLGFLMQHYLPSSNFLFFAIKGLIWTSISGIILWLTAMNVDEKNMIKQVLHLR